jgi:tetratricopeptide (TPR) repeat protein
MDVTVTLLPFVVILLLPTVTNIAAGDLPSSWRPYLWIAWLLAFLLSIPVIVAETRKSRSSEGPQAQATASRPADRAQALRRDLPRDVPDFTNRDEELNRIAHLLGDTHSQKLTVPVLAIHGMAGVGKTTLAVHAAHRVAASFPDGQLFVDLHGLTANAAIEPAEALEILLRGVGVPAEQVPQALTERASMYRDRLVGRRILVVLDNAASERQVSPLLPSAPGCAVLTTSRGHLAGLEGAYHLPVDVLGPEAATELFTKIVGIDRLGAEAASVGEITDMCGRLALAIRIAGARMATRPKWSAATLLHRLHDQQWTGEFRIGTLDVPVAFSLSYDQLDAVDQRVFRALGLHPGVNFDLAAAAALGDVGPHLARQVLDELVEASLLNEGADGRYQLHDLLRQYAREVSMATDSTEEQQAAFARLVSYYLRCAGSAGRLLDPEQRNVLTQAPATAGPGSFSTYAEALSWLETERSNLVAVLRAAARAGRDADVWRLTYVMYPYFFLRGSIDDWIETHELALPATRRLGDPLAEADILFGLGVACRRLGRYQESLGYQQEALTSYRAAGDIDGQITTLTNLGIAYRRLGRYGEALDHQERALALYADSPDRRGEAAALTNIGIVHERLGHYQKSLEYHARALRLAREVKDRHAEAMTLTNTGIVHERLGEFRDALRHHRQALALAHDIGDQHVEGHTMNNIGVVLNRMGSQDDSITHHTAGLDLLARTGSRGDECEALIDTGDSLREHGEDQPALDHYRRALQLAGQIGDPYLEARALAGQASVTATTDADASQRDQDKALRIFEELGVPDANPFRHQAVDDVQGPPNGGAPPLRPARDR